MISQLIYKCEEKRIPFVTIPTYNTTKYCYKCGSLNSKRSEDSWECLDCGYKEHSDLHGAKNCRLYGKIMYNNGDTGNLSKFDVNKAWSKIKTKLNLV